MQNTKFRFGPVALSTVYTTNLLNPATAAGGVNAGSASQYILLNHIRIVNKTTSIATFRLYVGATGGNVAGTEIMGFDKPVPANDSVDFYPAGGLLLKATDFLVGGAGTTLALVIEGSGEVGVSG